MILPLHEALKNRVRAILAEAHGLGEDAGVTIAIETPPNRTMGDLGTPVAFDLARRLRKNLADRDTPVIITGGIAGAAAMLQNELSVRAVAAPEF